MWSDYDFLDHPPPLAVAHRGGAAHGPENTMSAFAAAVDLGYRYVETDVHATADGVLVAFHDRTLRRVTGRVGRIEQLPWSRLSVVRFGAGERVPLLADVLGSWPQLRVTVDVKADSAVGPLVDVVRRTGSVDRICVGSFSDRRNALLRAALGPRLCTSLGPREVLRLRVASYARDPRQGGTPGVPCAQIPRRLWPIPVADARFIRQAHGLGMQVHVWTVDDPVEMHRLLDLGADGIISDNIVGLRDVLVDRGAWAG